MYTGTSSFTVIAGGGLGSLFGLLHYFFLGFLVIIVVAICLC